MKRRSPFVMSALVLILLCGTFVHAQNTPPSYANVICVKVKPGQAAAYERLERDIQRQYFQAPDTSDPLVGFVLARNFYPGGTAAECSYQAIYLMNGVSELHTEMRQQRWKKAKMPMTYEEYISKLMDSITLVKRELWQTLGGAGKGKRGDWVRISYHNRSDQAAFRKGVQDFLQPMAEVLVKEKDLQAWHSFSLSLPSGGSLPYNNSVVSVYQDFASAQQHLQRLNYTDRFRKRFGKTPDEAGLQRQLPVRVEIFRVVDAITSGGGGATPSGG